MSDVVQQKYCSHAVAGGSGKESHSLVRTVLLREPLVMARYSSAPKTTINYWKKTHMFKLPHDAYCQASEIAKIPLCSLHASSMYNACGTSVYRFPSLYRDFRMASCNSFKVTPCTAFMVLFEIYQLVIS